MLLKNINLHLHPVIWPAHNVLAFTSTRYHPSTELAPNKTPNIKFSKYSAFNLGDHVGDDHQCVMKNRASLLDFLPLSTRIQWFEQVHGVDVAHITCYSEKPVTADAAITSDMNIALAMMTADCLPIVLSSKYGDEIAAIHGGWRPLVGNIIANTVNQMQCSNEDIFAWLGPCIGADKFEVGDDVKDQFVKQSKIFEHAFNEKKNSKKSETLKQPRKYLADLALIAKLQLNQLGIKNINQLSHCTFTREREYFSYRRDGQTGRMATIICRT